MYCHLWSISCILRLTCLKTCLYIEVSVSHRGWIITSFFLLKKLLYDFQGLPICQVSSISTIPSCTLPPSKCVTIAEPVFFFIVRICARSSISSIAIFYVLYISMLGNLSLHLFSFLTSFFKYLKQAFILKFNLEPYICIDRHDESWNSSQAMSL